MTYVFVIGIILVVIPATVNGQSVAVVGKNFHYQILRRTYFDPIPDSAVYFKASSTGKPGLPAWLKYIQEDPKMDTAYLYGTPTPSDIGTASIEIVAFNADTYDTKILAITISVEENHVPNSYFVTFNVTNKDVGDMYSPDPNSGKMTIDAFVGTVKTIWSDAQNLAVADITSSLDAGGRVPIPGQPTGVVIQIGSQSDFSSGIKNAAVSPCEASFQIFTDNGFDINWCYFNTTVKEMNDKSTINPSPVVLGAVYVAPVLTVEERDLTTEFILVVIVPLAVAIVLAIILSYIMCARREGVEKRINATPTVQLTHHSHIKNATKELRDMSMRREGAQPLSTLPAFRLSPTPGSRTGQHSPPQD
ncbi:epsilon-sarcoglycan-like, partial [Saccoglossus kowalevskii]|uniref:Epsilon-sarcoglycan-like n=1 Tax=Saccoglossus kowalevskii TaxID=10224 RepID=A0ABM0MC53_SACKO